MARDRLYPIMLNTAQVAASCGVDRKVVYEWFRRGLPRYRVNSKQKVLTADVVEFARAHFQRVN